MAPYNDDPRFKPQSPNIGKIVGGIFAGITGIIALTILYYSAQQQVQTAEATAKATLLQAEANAKQIELEGRAHALAADLMAKAIASNPRLVEYEYAKKWNGTMPHMVPPGNAPMLLQVPGR